MTLDFIAGKKVEQMEFYNAISSEDLAKFRTVLDIVEILLELKTDTYNEAKNLLLPAKDSPGERFYKCLFEYTDKRRSLVFD